MKNIRTALQGLISLLIKRNPFIYYPQKKLNDINQWNNKTEIEQFQLKSLNKILTHASKTIPYYKTLIKERKLDLPLKSLDELQKLPIITKKEILNQREAFISSKYPGILRRNAFTGGTTGTPLKISRDIFSICREHAFVKRQWEMVGIGRSDRCAFLTGRVFKDVNKSKGDLSTYDPFMKELYLSTYHLNSKNVFKYVDAIKKYNIRFLVGYPSAVYSFSLLCKEQNLQIQFESILTSSEVLDSRIKDQIQSIFKCPLYDFYGSAERTSYIFTCQKGNYHIQEDYGYTELLPLPELGQKKFKLIATGFWNLSMPFIRYDSGDIVELHEEDCTCGRSSRVIKKIYGRSGDLLKLKNGQILGAAILTHVLYGVENIRESQLIQEDIENVTFLYVPASDFSREDFNLLKQLIEKHIPDILKVTIREVETIPKTGSGKLKPVISRIK